MWIIRKYKLYKLSIIDDIQSSLTKIHLTVDLWTSGNHKSVLGVVAHYISKEGQLKHNVLALRELEGDHSGENQSRVVIDVILDFQIATNLGFFVGDNDSRNDTLCQALSQCTFLSLFNETNTEKYYRARGRVYN